MRIILILHQHNSIEFYTFEELNRWGVTHAIFTRKGGVSPRPWHTLNLGGTVGDHPERVGENRRLAFAAVGVDSQKIYDVWQVHSADVVVVDTPRDTTQPHLKADAMITDKRGIALFMRFADCVPILLFDRAKGVIGLVHAGWKGTLSKIVVETIRLMEATYFTKPTDIIAGIGPSIGGHHYQVGIEVFETARKIAPQIAEKSFRFQGDGIFFDLWKANTIWLESMGVKFIEVSGICTVCNPEQWFSHRGENGKTGRFGAVIRL